MRVSVLVVLAALLAAACAGPAPAAPATTTPAASPVVAATPAPTTPAPKTTLEIAYADDPSREALLWAITHGKVSSPLIDVKVRFLPLAQIIPAVNTKQFEAIEASPLAVARTAGAEPGLLILSNGLVNIGGTALVTGKSSPLASPADLKGKTVAVASLGGTFVLETRYVLQKKFGLNTDLKTGEVKFSETPQETVPQLLKDGRLDAAVTTQLLTFRLKDSADHRILSEVTKEFQALTGKRSVNSVVVTYRDKLAAKGKALAELQQLLKRSLEYFRGYRSEVINDVASSRKLDPKFLEWFFTVYDLAAGPVSAEDAAGIVASWEAAKLIGDIKDVPKVEEVTFKGP